MGYRPYDCTWGNQFKQQAEEALQDAQKFKETYCYGDYRQYKAKKIKEWEAFWARKRSSMLYEIVGPWPNHWFDESGISRCNAEIIEINESLAFLDRLPSLIKIVQWEVTHQESEILQLTEGIEIRLRQYKDVSCFQRPLFCLSNLASRFFTSKKLEASKEELEQSYQQLSAYELKLEREPETRAKQEQALIDAAKRIKKHKEIIRKREEAYLLKKKRGGKYWTRR